MLTTGEDGSYSGDLPIGLYTVTVARTNFTGQTRMVSIVAGQPTVADVSLEPVARVVVKGTVEGSASPGGVVTGKATVEVLDGSELEGIAWRQTGGVEVELTPGEGGTAELTLPEEWEYRGELIRILKEAPIAQEGEFLGGLRSRYQVVAVPPLAVEEVGSTKLVVTATTTSGAYPAAVSVQVKVPWEATPGLRDVPLGRVVLLHGKDHTDADGDGVDDVTGLPAVYDWTLETPVGSEAELTDGEGQDPWFRPDVTGLYTVKVTDTTSAPGTEVVALSVYAGRWKGVITGRDAEGRPVADECTGCHDGSTAPDKFTPWSRSLHAEIFSVNLDTSTHYGESCFPCHTVGYSLGAKDGGIDEAEGYGEFLKAGLLNKPGDNWTKVLRDYPAVAQEANIQCENCHGPQGGGAHMKGGARIDLSSEVCGTCHGEPARHGRYQQWQLSGHGNKELAEEEGTNGNCARCHTANGFLAWLPALKDPAGNVTANVAVTWKKEETHPQTCVACHDPHTVGTEGSEVRISGTTPMLLAGFRAVGVGKGAVCMTCHNGRRGLRNDGNFDTFAGTTEASRTPHSGPQADVLMGQNAYLVAVGERGSHWFIADTCVTCHMELSPRPEELSYQQGGTNHTFEASAEICGSCHGEGFNARGVQEGIEAALANLKGEMESGIVKAMEAQVALGNTVDLGKQATVKAVGDVKGVDFAESHGAQGVTVTLSDGTQVGPLTISSLTVLDGTGKSLGDLYKVSDSRLAKAGWNYSLIANDKSRGVHNPAFAFRVLEASSAALEELMK